MRTQHGVRLYDLCEGGPAYEAKGYYTVLWRLTWGVGLVLSGVQEFCKKVDQVWTRGAN